MNLLNNNMLISQQLTQGVPHYIYAEGTEYYKFGLTILTRVEMPPVKVAKESDKLNIFIPHPVTSSVYGNLGTDFVIDLTHADTLKIDWEQTGAHWACRSWIRVRKKGSATHAIDSQKANKIDRQIEEFDVSDFKGLYAIGFIGNISSPAADQDYNLNVYNVWLERNQNGNDVVIGLLADRPPASEMRGRGYYAWDETDGHKLKYSDGTDWVVNQ